MSASYEQRKSILCRLCLQELENGIDIFACFPKIRLPAKMIAELLQTCVSKEDEYPQKVCSECFKKLLRYYTMSKRNDLSTCAEFVLFKEQCKIAASTIDYAKEKAECDGQHTPVSEELKDHSIGKGHGKMDHSPLNLNLEELGMEDEKEFEMKQDPCYLLEAVAGILKNIRCAQMGLLPGKAKENISEDSFSLNAVPEDDEEFPKLCIESSDDCSDDEKQTFTAIREGVSESTAGNLAENYCKSRLRNARRPNNVESKSEERTRREEFREKNNSSVPAKSESPWKLRRKSSINDLKRHRIPRRKKPSGSPKSSSSSPKSSSTSYGSDSRNLELFSIGAGESWNSSSNSDDSGTRQQRGKKFNYRSRRVLMTDKKFECKICGRVFMIPKDLKSHMKAHSHTTDVPKSPEFIRSPRKGRVKIKEERDPSIGLGVQCDSSPTSKKFTCDGCGVKFNKVGDLEIHLGQHFDVVNLICNICGVKFCRYRYMKRHLVRHLGIKMISCGQCGKSFDTKTNLRIHSAVHSTETPFDCSHCGKAFRSRMLLMVHIKTHNPVKPWQCKLCDSSFVQRSDLTKHMAVHTRVRKFSCSTCGKAYLHKRNLKQHERVHDSSYKGYVCSYCGKTYLNKCDLRRHISNLISDGKIVSRNCSTGRKKKAKHKLRVVIK